MTEFNDIESQAQQRKEAVRAALRRVDEDDDIQIYQRPWVGLTDDELFKIWVGAPSETEDRFALVKAVIAKLKEKNTSTTSFYSTALPSLTLTPTWCLRTPRENWKA